MGRVSSMARAVKGLTTHCLAELSAARLGYTTALPSAHTAYWERMVCGTEAVGSAYLWHRPCQDARRPCGGACRDLGFTC